MQIIELKTDELIPYVNNPRQNDEAVDHVAASIRSFGFRVPIIIDKEKTIVAGHTRLRAAKKLGLETVPCIMADDLSEQQIKAFRLADNKVSEFASWDMDKLMIELEALDDIDMSEYGFDEMEKEAEDFLKEVEEDEAPEVEEEQTRVKFGQIWQLGKHRLMCGDSTNPLNIKDLMGGVQADLYLTDPPYNIDYEGKTKDALKIQNDSFSSKSEFVDFLSRAFQGADEIMKEGAAFYIWHAHTESKSFFEATERIGWQIRQCLVWNKSIFSLGRQDYQWKHEPCLYGWKDGAGHYFIDDRKQSTVFSDVQEINPKKMKKEELVKLVEEMLSDKISTTVLNEDKPSASEEHPTMKPIKLLARQICNSSKTNQIVLDSFGGSGSTLIACEQLQRICYMMELDPVYADVIIRRWENFTGQTAKLIRE